MLQRLLPFGGSLNLAFERGECVLVPQTAGYVALHADVRLTLASRRRREVEDAFLVWSDESRDLRRSRWDRAVVDGRFRYPPAAPGIIAGGAPLAVTLTFTDPLIAHDGPAPPTSRIRLELAISGTRRPVARELWRLSMRTWDEPAAVAWVGS